MASPSNKRSVLVVESSIQIAMEMGFGGRFFAAVMAQDVEEEGLFSAI